MSCNYNSFIRPYIWLRQIIINLCTGDLAKFVCLLLCSITCFLPFCNNVFTVSLCSHINLMLRHFFVCTVFTMQLSLPHLWLSWALSFLTYVQPLLSALIFFFEQVRINERHLKYYHLLYSLPHVLMDNIPDLTSSYCANNVNIGQNCFRRNCNMRSEVSLKDTAFFGKGNAKAVSTGNNQTKSRSTSQMPAFLWLFTHRAQAFQHAPSATE